MTKIYNQPIDFRRFDEVPKKEYLLLETDEKIELARLIEINNKIYTVTSAGGKLANNFYDWVEVSEINLLKLPSIGDSEITCPYCGTEEGDSWEADDEDDNRYCDTCGALFKYQKEVSISYYSELIEPPEEPLVLGET